MKTKYAKHDQLVNQNQLVKYKNTINESKIESEKVKIESEKAKIESENINSEHPVKRPYTKKV